MPMDILLALSFTLAFVSIVAIFFTDKKIVFSVLAAVLLFYFYKTNMDLGNANLTTLLIFISGLILLGLEIFVPSFGILGILGVVLTAYSIYDIYDSSSQSIMLLLSTALAVIITIFVFVKLGFSAKIFNRNILDKVQDKERGYNSKKDYSDLVGKTGKSVTILRPTGRILIEGKNYDAKSDSEFIGSDKDIRVVSFKDGHIIVEEIKNLY
ncbi:MAG: NfeD family protein [Finegoldia sp.]|nr:NfeD family protein [Finegoldia sp.]